MSGVMRKASVAFIALALIGFGIASCGRYQREQRAAWRDEAEAACLARGEVQASAYMSLRSTPIQGPGSCGMNRPVRVNAFAAGGIGLTTTQTLACPIVATTEKFLAEIVQPAAMANLGAQVIEMRAGSYSCRAMNNGSGTSRRSEHSYGNALDIFSFRLNDGREITVRHGWRGSQQEQDFLREVFVGACSIYRTVLGPGADMFHYDHLHVDLARHAGGRRVCRPIIKFTPRRDQQPDHFWRSREVAQNESLQAPVRPGMPAQPQSPRQAYAALTPQPGVGPIRLPGSVVGPEELIVGDIEGDQIDPDNDPFALDDPQKPRQPAQQGGFTPRPPLGPSSAPAHVPARPQALAPVQAWQAPAPPQPRREWPPRF